MQHDERNLETIPAGALGLIALESCREIGENRTVSPAFKSAGIRRPGS